ncbi:MAG: hydrolase [Planctomycetaceae bacterium]|jgi:nicotinamidase-related amidase|nr:hydrolase [Planctomycetaceae bacterium]
MTFEQNMTLLSPMNSALLIIDVQERLIPAMQDGDLVVWNARRLIDGAKLFDVPIFVTEQYPQGLGATAAELKTAAPKNVAVFEKKSFSACLVPEFLEELRRNDAIRKIVVAGIESHVCVLQTALDLMSFGYEIHLAADVVRSRFADDYNFALRRLETSGCFLTTTESVLFQWCRTADAPQFKEISRIVRSVKP